MFNRNFIIAALLLTNALPIMAKDGAEMATSGMSYQDQQLASHEKQLQQLLNRIEILEHNYQQLWQQVGQIPPPVASRGVQIEQEIHAQPTLSAPILDEASVQRGKNLYTIALATFKEAICIRDDKAKQQKIAEAQKVFERFITEYPADVLIPNAYFWLGEILFQQQLYKEAISQYTQGYNLAKTQDTTKKSPYNKAADSLLKIGMSLSALGERSAACKVMDKLEKEFPSTERSNDSKNHSRDVRNKCGCNSSTRPAK